MTLKSLEHACVFGLGWGDEGKGKVVDLLCPAFHVGVRFNGGANAGHTVYVGSEKFALHLLPTGAIHPGFELVIGPGVVVDPLKLIEEIDGLHTRGIDLTGRLHISDRAHVVLAWHKIEDQLSEGAAAERARIGTTARGIGPCYADKARRSTAVRFADLARKHDLEDRVRRIADERRRWFQALYGTDGGLTADAVLRDLDTARARLSGMVCDSTAFLHDALHHRRPILFEGANGVLLDKDHGTYPFVTSSSTGPYGIGPGAGVPEHLVTRRVGVVKAYSTRVGAGPFVSELRDDVGDRIRVQGNEFGTTTGRPRRCGWFDAVTCRYAATISGATDLAMMHLDTLSGFDRVGICTSYRCDGETLHTIPADATRLEQCEPVFEYLPGWKENLRSAQRMEDLPPAVVAYLQRIETLIGVPVSLVGVGPERSQVITRGALTSLISPPPRPVA